MFNIISEPRNISLSSCPPLHVLDFRPHYPCFDVEDTTQCDAEWPCEVRIYWLQIHPFISFTRAFLSYGSLVIIALGVILNSLSFLVLVSSGLAKNGSGVYLLALAVCDSGNLIANILIGVVRGWSPEFNGIFMDNEWLCRSHGVFVEVFQTISAWIVVAFTVERCLAVWYPMLFRQSRNYRAKLIVAGLTLTFTLFCLSKLFLTGFEKDSVFGYVPCNSKRYVWEGMAYVRIAFQTWIPTIIVFTCNCLMFWKLRKIKRKRKWLTEHEQKKGQSQVKGQGQGQGQGQNGHPRARRTQSFINRRSATNPMLIAVSLAYLILVCPLGAVQSVELYWNHHYDVPVSVVEPGKSLYVNWIIYRIVLKYVRSFFFGFYQLNFAINFFLYFAAGVEFRRYLTKKLGCCSPLPNSNSAGACSANAGDSRRRVRPNHQSSCASNATTITNISLAHNTLEGLESKTTVSTTVSNATSVNFAIDEDLGDDSSSSSSSGVDVKNVSMDQVVVGKVEDESQL